MTNTQSGDLFPAILSSPHTLIAGTTGSGKSTFIDNILHHAEQTLAGKADFIIIDCKRISLSRWERLPGLLHYARDAHDAADTLERCADYMDRVYRSLEETGAVEYGGKHLYIIIDELADLMTGYGSHTAERIRRELLHLLRLGRAARVHIIAATQSPNRRTIPAELVSNFTHRVGLRCISPIESRQIIGEKGCEELPRIGYCIVRAPNGLFLRKFGKV